MDWFGVIETFLADGAVALLTAVIGFFFAKRYTSKLLFTKKMNDIGIERVGIKNRNNRQNDKMFAESKEIKMIFVSGKNFLKQQRSNILCALERGCKIKVLLAMPGSEFLSGIEKLEVSNGNREEGFSISDEVIEIIKLYKETKMEIRLYQSEYRMPLILSYDNESRCDAWLTVSLPPYKSGQDNFYLIGHHDIDVELKDLDFIEMMETHFNMIWNYAAYQVDEALQYYYTKEQYMKLEVQAKETMKQRTGKCCLIEVVQSPLQKGNEISEEFKIRLDKAFEIYQKHECCQIYVLDNQYKKDDILLNNASKDYLLALGVKKEDILEKKECRHFFNDKYYFEDECDVVSELFKSNKTYGKLICICSLSQIHPNALRYIRNGLLPEFVSVSVSNMQNVVVDEVLSK